MHRRPSDIIETRNLPLCKLHETLISGHWAAFLAKRQSGPIMAEKECVNIGVSEASKLKIREEVSVKKCSTVTVNALTPSIPYTINITGQRRISSHITRSVLEHLVINMLQPEIRLPAKNVFDRSNRLIKEFEQKYDISVDGPVGNTNGEVVSQAKPRTRKPPQLPPDADSTSSSSSSRSPSPPHQHYHKSKSPRSKRRSTGASGIPQPGGRDLPAVSDPLHPRSNTANTHANSPPQQAQSNQQALAPPTMSIAEGHEWKRKHKNKEHALLPGRENLTTLNERDHVSTNVLSRLSLANRWS